MCWMWICQCEAQTMSYRLNVITKQIVLRISCWRSTAGCLERDALEKCLVLKSASLNCASYWGVIVERAADPTSNSVCFPSCVFSLSVCGHLPHQQPLPLWPHTWHWPCQSWNVTLTCSRSADSLSLAWITTPNLEFAATCGNSIGALKC